ncbi:DNA-directed RNA polymerase I subunit RPA43-like [Homarus americanus]|uniref:DNA-directed RNA polymerase I subunit RPA43-like n=1 Tax=Homarus americanus TaxID=6706 RepID=A0A8J5JI85_HOMAM|nr:DNA-directed RNA polymerase I subunit RPA43-like [Homarus americanus]KAG7153609.1 DNA-directed RNA polymerase I subunit RPA43-like [Homarus americanus]
MKNTIILRLCTTPSDRTNQPLSSSRVITRSGCSGGDCEEYIVPYDTNYSWIIQDTKMALEDYLEEARKLAALPESCIKKVESQLTLLVHPMHYQNLKKGVFEELNALKKRYSKVLGGIAMAYEDVQVVSSNGWLFDTNPFNHIIIRAQFYIFAPEIGSILEGVVKKKTVNHIGCLVHGMFNVSVPRPMDTSVDSWCGTYVEEEDGVKLTITYVSMTNFMPYIKAELHPEQVQELLNSKSQDDTPQQNTKIIFDDDSGISSSDLELQMENEKKEEKQGSIPEQSKEDNKKDKGKNMQKVKVKGKKRKRPEENDDESQGEELLDVKKKKKKRKEYDIEEDIIDLITDSMKGNKSSSKKNKKRKCHSVGENNESSDLKFGIEEEQNNRENVKHDGEEMYMPSISMVDKGSVKKSRASSKILKKKTKSQKLDESNTNLMSSKKSESLKETEFDSISNPKKLKARHTSTKQRGKSTNKFLSEELEENRTSIPKISSKSPTKKRPSSGKSKKHKAETSPESRKSGKKKKT